MGSRNAEVGINLKSEVGINLKSEVGMRKSENKKIEAESSKSKDVIDFICVWFEVKADWRKGKKK